jgi:hypothetical protein
VWIAINVQEDKISDLRFRTLLTEGRFEVLFHREELESLADIRKSV